MAILLNNVTTTDTVSDNEIESPNAVGLSLLIANKAVIVNFKRPPSSRSNESSWSEDLLLTPQTAQYRNVSGFRVKSAIPGSPAQVVAVLSEPSDPQAMGATPYTASLSSSGAVTPGGQALQVQKDGVLIGTEPILDFEDANGFVWALADDGVGTRIKVTPPRFIGGRIHAVDGSINGGTGGFTSARIGVGSYQIRFTTAFPVIPITTVSLTVIVQGIVAINALTVNGFDIQTYTTGFVNSDFDWSFHTWASVT